MCMKKKIRRKVYLLAYIFMGSLFLLSAWQIGFYFFNGYKTQVSAESLSEMVDLSLESAETDWEDYRSLFMELKKTNENTVAYIRIENTRIDYPVVQTTDNEYYLNRDFEGKVNSHGAIFMDYRNTPDFSDQNTILYGHNMRDGTMFKDLLKYSGQKDKAQLSFYVLVITEKGVSRWEIFSAYEASIAEPIGSLGFLTTYFSKDEDWKAFLDSAIKRSTLVPNISVGEKDKLLTLTTCTNNRDDYRYVVHARAL